jgi:hypothetical protein
LFDDPNHRGKSSCATDYESGTCFIERACVQLGHSGDPNLNAVISKDIGQTLMNLTNNHEAGIEP